MDRRSNAENGRVLTRSVSRFLLQVALLIGVATGAAPHPPARPRDRLRDGRGLRPGLAGEWLATRGRSRSSQAPAAPPATSRRDRDDAQRAAADRGTEEAAGRPAALRPPRGGGRPAPGWRTGAAPLGPGRVCGGTAALATGTGQRSRGRGAGALAVPSPSPGPATRNRRTVEVPEAPSPERSARPRRRCPRLPPPLRPSARSSRTCRRRRPRPPCPSRPLLRPRPRVRRRWNVFDLQSRARQIAGRDPARDEETVFLLLHLREFVDIDGELGEDFDGVRARVVPRADRGVSALARPAAADAGGRSGARRRRRRSRSPAARESASGRRRACRCRPCSDLSGWYTARPASAPARWPGRPSRCGTLLEARRRSASTTPSCPAGRSSSCSTAGRPC